MSGTLLRNWKLLLFVLCIVISRASRIVRVYWRCLIRFSSQLSEDFFFRNLLVGRKRHFKIKVLHAQAQELTYAKQKSLRKSGYRENKSPWHVCAKKLVSRSLVHKHFTTKSLNSNLIESRGQKVNVALHPPVYNNRHRHRNSFFPQAIHLMNTWH